MVVNLHFLRRRARGCGVKGLAAIGAFVTGAALLLVASYIHFHLWQSEGYRHIPTVGDLFLLQSLAGLVIAIFVVVVRRVWAGIVAAGFALSTLVGFLISVNVGLFGFQDSSSAPFAHEAFAIELAAVVIFVIAALLCSTEA